MATPTLVTNRYVPPGTYIGQIIRPSPANLNADARVPAYIGRGNRLALGSNLPIRRSFVYGEQLAFPMTPPFISFLQHASDGSKDAPVRLYKQDGTEVRADQYQLLTINNEIKQVLINTEAYDASATYKFDYQSVDRDVLDPVPVQDLRSIKAVGLQEGQPSFHEYVDFFIDSTITDAVPNANNTNLNPNQGILISYVNAGTGTIAFEGSSQYAHNYNRSYDIVCLSVTGVTPNRQAIFEWSADPRSGGNNAAPATPLTASATKPTFTVDEASSAYIFDLEYGLKLILGFGATNFVAGDTYRFDAVGPSLFEVDARLQNTNQFVEYTPIIKTAQVGSTGQLTLNDNSGYTGAYNIKYSFKVESVTGSGPTATATISWSESGETFVNGSFTANNAVLSTLVQTLSKGITLDISFGATNFVAGDLFTFNVLAPRRFYSGKDTRNLKIDVTTVVNASANQGLVQGTYLADTIEGGFGTFIATATYDRTQVGLVELPDNLALFARNLFRKWTVGSQSAVNDEFTFSAIDNAMIDWTLNAQGDMEIEASDILNDVLGTVTGVPNSFYIVLNDVPLAGSVVVRDATTEAILSSTEVSGSAFVFFITNPNTRLHVTYLDKGQEPDPGSIYYLTGTFVRPIDLYDTPTLALSRTAGQTLLAPVSANNHLYIMNDIAWDNGTPAAYFIQVRDIDSDGVYTNLDFRRALLSTEHVSRITDRIVLANFASVSDELAINLRANDPFEKRESLDWFGAPIATPIGDVDTANTLVFIARKTLQVYGSSPSHGTRILHGATTCKRTIQFDDGTEQQLTLDGSFVAGALAALTASFTDPSDTILRKNVSGFDFIQTYSDAENIILGTNQIIYFTDQGSGVYRIEEDVTVDSFAEEFQIISAMTQKQSVTKIVRREMDNALISLVVPSSEAGVNLTKATLSGILIGLLSRGNIADYQDDSGNVRKFDPSADVIVFKDATNSTTYNFLYAYFIKYPIKRLFGLYQTGSNVF